MNDGRCRQLRIASIFAVVATVVGVALAAEKKAEIDLSKLPPAVSRPVDFAKDVRPIFEHHCLKCHGPEKQKSDYRLDLKESALKGGSIGGAIVPRESGRSALIHYVAGAHEEIRMPPKGDLLSAGQVGVLRAWIDQGAKWAETPAVAAATRPSHWSLLPLKKPPLPAVKAKDWVRTPIDAFILAKLEEKGMYPSVEADRRTLIRRVTFDLTGLPPTPAEVEAFVADTSPAAYETVVDRLLASARYGERWARHWMDVVHYAETHGHDEDKVRPNAWPYRDYLIQSFNADKPYARFVREQVAGDVLYPDGGEGAIATAFLAVGPWDESSQMGIMDGTLDKQNARYLDRDDMLMTTMSTFVSSTVHCARCHNHKFDPIPQTDYYALQAVFAGVDRIDRPYDADPKVGAERRRLTQEKAALEGGAYPMAALLAEDAQRRVAAWERGRKDAVIAWTVLDPVKFESTGGATLTKLADGSILSGGTRPEKDTVTITAPAKLKRITAIRLEVLKDPSLPYGGPGRQPGNGNLHLSEFKVGLTPDELAGTTNVKWLPIGNASADFDQDGWTIAKAIDGKAETAWGIHPKEGASHFAVFELKTALTVESEARLTFSLAQLHGGSHLIGRARLSVTDTEPPVRAKAFPDSVAAAIAIPAEKRTEVQRAELARHVLREDVERKLAELPAPQRIYGVASDFAPQGNFKPAKKPREVHVLRRGDIRQPIEVASPGALSCVEGLPARFKVADPEDEAARRAALAEWLSDAKNVLTWRSIVNRVWHYHFGRGIVETPNDFGKMGAAPTHPELLDWLATTFRDDAGGSLKRLHRLIVTSAVYRQASASNPTFVATDGENRMLWRMNRARLDAEAVRDAVLAISGKLDLTMGGPSVRQFVETKGVHETPGVDYANFDVDSPGSLRRSVYRFVFRTMPDPFMQTLDCPDSSQLAPRRETSLTALQALAMMNDRFVIRQSRHVAERLEKSSREVAGQIDLLYRLALGRTPDAQELAAVSRYAEKHGLANAVRMLLNSNEFMFVQ